MINDDAIFTLNNGDIEEFYIDTFLECVAKDGIKLLSQYLKAYSMLCGN